jgi:hypothetical protein
MDFMGHLFVSGGMFGLLGDVSKYFLLRNHGSFTVIPAKREWFFNLSISPDIRNARVAGIITCMLVVYQEQYSGPEDYCKQRQSSSFGIWRGQPTVWLLTCH